MPDAVLKLQIESDAFSCDDLQVYEIEGREAIGRLFEFELGVVSTSAAGLDVGEVEGAPVTLVFLVDDQEVRRLHGMIARVDDMLDTEPETQSYRFIVVPRAHRLTLVRTQEIFMNLSVPEIIQSKLDLVGLGASDLAMRLQGSYPKREFVVQYKETDLAFVSRLVEHEGISISFDHQDGLDKIVFTDDNARFPVAEGHEAVAFRGRGDRCDVFHIEARTTVVPRLHVVHDYNYRIPLVDPTGNAEAASGFAGGLVEYGAHVKTPEEAARLAGVRAQETEATHRVYALRSDLPWVTAGGRFTLEGHPKLDDLALLVTDVEHSARLPVVLHGGTTERPYTNTFHAVAAEVPFRPPRITPRPRIHGLLNGVVAHEIEGTDSIFARLDDQGRYLVRMMFDTSPRGERSAVSRRIRMAQPHAGTNYGHHFPLKPGTEVLVAFIDGDPDRPIIVATVPNPITSSPVASSCAPAHRIKTATGILIEMKDA